MTYLIPGTVKEVSATLVDKMMRRPFEPRNIFCCSSFDSLEKRGSI
jgi:hypothetical protein